MAGVRLPLCACHACCMHQLTAQHTCVSCAPVCAHRRYPFDVPSEAFTFLRFKQAFAAIQASIVHLQVCVCVCVCARARACLFLFLFLFLAACVPCWLCRQPVLRCHTRCFARSRYTAPPQGNTSPHAHTRATHTPRHTTNTPGCAARAALCAGAVGPAPAVVQQHCKGGAGRRVAPRVFVYARLRAASCFCCCCPTPPPPPPLHTHAPHTHTQRAHTHTHTLNARRPPSSTTPTTSAWSWSSTGTTHPATPCTRGVARSPTRGCS
jgi:hypothetical protein